MNRQRRYAPIAMADPRDRDGPIAAFTMAGIRIKAVEQLDRMLERLTRRLAVLLEAHRHEYSDRPIIHVGGVE